MGIGATIFIDQEEAFQYSLFVPAHKNNTNNIAEYLAFKSILNFLKDKQIENEKIQIYGDSKLVVEQMKGNWQMRGGAYIPYAKECLVLIKELKTVNKITFLLEWIPRHLNSYADELSKRELQNHGVQFRLQKPMLNAAQ